MLVSGNTSGATRTCGSHHRNPKELPRCARDGGKPYSARNASMGEILAARRAGT
jgi:hypothetical protein